jgi:MYXO-CTERM domain-containing protein
MPSPLRSLVTLALTSSLLSISTSTPAHAVVVNLGGIDYEVLTRTASYPAEPAAFYVANSLGPGYSSDYGPIFAFAHDSGAATISGITQNLTDSNDQLILEGNDALPDYDPLDPSTPLSYVFAYGYAVTPPAPSSSVPAPLPLLGAAAAVSWSRRIRGRMGSTRF